MEQRANILVTEMFDTELIGEAALHVFNHAHKCLLERDCIVVPMKATMYAQVVHSNKLVTWNRIRPIPIPDTKESILVPTDVKDCPGHLTLHDLQLDQLDQGSFTPVSKPMEVFK